MLLASFTVLAFSFAAQIPQDVQRQITVSPETVTVGTPFEVTVRVAAPKGSQVRFPPGPDTTEKVRMLDPVAIVVNDTISALVQTATYRLAAWDVNEQPIDLGDLSVVSASSGALQRIPLDVPPIIVQSVLPPDDAARVPKPARGLFGMPQPWWYPWLPLAVLALCLAAIFRWWYSRRKVVVVRYEQAVLDRSAREFQRIESMRLVEAGERGRHVVLMVDALREFLAARIAGASPSQTSAELVGIIENYRSDLPVDRIVALINEADMVKYARSGVSAGTAIRIGREAAEIARKFGSRLENAQVQSSEDAA